MIGFKDGYSSTIKPHLVGLYKCLHIYEKHEIGSTITNSMVSVVLPWKTGFKYINGTYDMNMSKVLPI